MQSVLSPLVGRLSDVLDRKLFASIPPLIAFVGSIICAKATSMNMVIGGGILIGVTLATISIVQSIPSEILPMKYRPLANGFAYLGGAVGGLYVAFPNHYFYQTTNELQSRWSGCRCRDQYRSLGMAKHLLDPGGTPWPNFRRDYGFLLAQEAYGLPEDEIYGVGVGLRPYR